MRLLEHEQLDIIQPRLLRATVLFDDFLSAATVLEYWANPFELHPGKMTAFPLAMLFFGWRSLLHNRDLPDFRDFPQRWFWIAKRVVPIFQLLDGSDEINASIDEIIAAGAQTVLPLQLRSRTSAAI